MVRGTATFTVQCVKSPSASLIRLKRVATAVAMEASKTLRLESIRRNNPISVTTMAVNAPAFHVPSQLTRYWLVAGLLNAPLWAFGEVAFGVVRAVVDPAVTPAPVPTRI